MESRYGKGSYPSRPWTTCRYWVIKNRDMVLKTIQDQRFDISSVNSFDFSTLYTMLPHLELFQKLFSLMNRHWSKGENKGEFKYFVMPPTKKPIGFLTDKVTDPEKCIFVTKKQIQDIFKIFVTN